MNLPNRLTIGRLVLCAFFVLALELPGGAPYAFVIFIVASLTDWLDGYLARKYNLVTDLGKLLDPLADKILVCAAFIALVAYELSPAWIVVCIVSREFLITGLRTLAAAKGIILAAEKAGKHKTISQMVTAILALAILSIDQQGWFPDESAILKKFALVPMLYLTLIITVYSGASYFLKNQKLLFDDHENA